MRHKVYKRQGFSEGYLKIIALNKQLKCVGWKDVPSIATHITYQLILVNTMIKGLLITFGLVSMITKVYQARHGV